jgi:hypothetical protein
MFGLAVQATSRATDMFGWKERHRQVGHIDGRFVAKRGKSYVYVVNFPSVFDHRIGFVPLVGGHPH